MQTIESKLNYDRSRWASGEWDSEPDKIQWLDLETNLPCLIVRNYNGALCGYVGVPETHKLFEKNYFDVDFFDVHGGLTYSAKCIGHICHEVEENDDDNIWWFGFDYAHADDLIPHYQFGGQYRNIAYVRAEVLSLAKQLKGY